VPIACQIPFKSGFPSAVRGALYACVVCPHDAALNHRADAATSIQLAMTTPLPDSRTKTPIRFVNGYYCTCEARKNRRAVPLPTGCCTSQAPLPHSRSWLRGCRFCGCSPSAPASPRKIQNRLHLNFRRERRGRCFYDRSGDLHFMANMEIQHVLIALKP